MKNKFRKYIIEPISEIKPKSLLILFLWSLGIDLIVETLARFQANGVITGSFWGGFVAVVKQPYVILYGALVIMFTVSFGLLFKKKYFAMILISSIWIIFALCDFVLLSYRVTPFSAVDFGMIDTALAVLTKYASVGAIIGVAIFAVLLVVAFIIFAKKSPVDQNRKISHGVIIIIFSFLLTFAASSIGRSTGLLATEFPNLADAYLENGFAYCFCSSIFNTGIAKPKTYSEDKTHEIVNDAPTEAATPASSDAPKPEEVKNVRIEDVQKRYDGYNVIFLQLESFFDITEVSKLSFSADPVPYFRSLIENCPSGYLSMPCIGAGTANTEFEVITGMDLDFFGPGEYPYKTVLKDTSCESLAFNLHDQGYATHAIHNNRASFYNRHKIFAHFGFDDFTSFELMNITENTPNGWAKDKFLTKEIMTDLKATDNRDFIYTISVQGHGKYPSSQLIENPEIQLLDGALESKWYGIEYYANQIREMDDFLRELTAELSAYDEPVLLIGYGDHLPGLGFTNEDLPNGLTLKQTQYFIWSNEENQIPLADEDIEAYQLGSKVMDYLGFDNGVINNFHQTNRGVMDEETYLEDLEILEYDILYGEKYVYGGNDIYEPTDMKFGVNEVAISEANQSEDDESVLLVTGDYFTQYSRIYINETPVETEFLDEHHVRCRLDDFEDGDQIMVCVCQTYKNKLILQRSNPLALEVTFTSDFETDDEDFENNNNNFE